MIKRLAVMILIGSVALAADARAQSAFEPPPVFKASDLAPASMLTGPRRPACP